MARINDSCGGGAAVVLRTCVSNRRRRRRHLLFILLLKTQWCNLAQLFSNASRRFPIYNSSNFRHFLPCQENVMTTSVKKGDRVVILVKPNVKGDDIKDFVGEVNRCTESAGYTTIVQSSTDFRKAAHGSSSVDVILSFVSDDDTVTEIPRVLKPGGSLVIHEAIDLAEKDNAAVKFASRISKLRLSGLSLKSTACTPVTSALKVEGLLSHLSDGVCQIVAEKPPFEIGSSVALNFAKPAGNVWKIDDAVEDDLIDEENLLDKEDVLKPEAASLRVCGTTGKRKACKDCSCGLAEELNGGGGGAPQQKTVTSSCGSCYLGDAFRCASCPYLGMPAFKPGEKVVLPSVDN